MLCVNATESRLITSHSGELDADKFAHYELNDKGQFKLVLVSLEGDADLYVSSAHRAVDYANYELQSTTYGVDEIQVDKSLPRPVYISVYAHPYYPKTKYKLYQYALKNVLNYEETNQNEGKNYAAHETFNSETTSDFMSSDFEHQYYSSAGPGSNHEADEDEPRPESILWSILLHLLQGVLDALLWIDLIKQTIF